MNLRAIRIPRHFQRREVSNTNRPPPPPRPSQRLRSGGVARRRLLCEGVQSLLGSSLHRGATRAGGQTIMRGFRLRTAHCTQSTLHTTHNTTAHTRWFYDSDLNATRKIEKINLQERREDSPQKRSNPDAKKNVSKTESFFWFEKKTYLTLYAAMQWQTEHLLGPTKKVFGRPTYQVREPQHSPTAKFQEHNGKKTPTMLLCGFQHAPAELENRLMYNLCVCGSFAGASVVHEM